MKGRIIDEAEIAASYHPVPSDPAFYIDDSENIYEDDSGNLYIDTFS
jgi:hypothetical protein